MTAVAPTTLTQPAETGVRADVYAWTVVLSLAIVNLVASMDRFVMGIVLVPLRTSMHLDDTELGMLYGLGFAILYAATGIPMGRIADAINRRNIIIAGCLMWSFGTLCCAFANSFATLMIARSAIGLGEAALVPAAISLLSAYVPRKSLGLANGVFFAGSTGGKAIAFIGGGLLLTLLTARDGLSLGGVHFVPWQALFLLATGPGLAAMLFALIIREPRRRIERRKAPPMRELVANVSQNARTYLFVTLGACCLQLSALTLAAWMPSFFVRRFAMDVGPAGVIVGVTGIVVGLIAALTGGWITDRLARRGVGAAPCLVISAALLASTPAAIATFILAQTPLQAAIAYGFLHGCILMGGPQCFAAIQQITPVEHRGLTGALLLSLIMLVSLGFGPTIIGLLSDHVFAHSGNELGLSLLVTVGICGLLGALFLFGVRSAFERSASIADALHNQGEARAVSA